MSTIKVLSKLDTEKILKNLSLNDIINTSLSAFHAHSNNLTESPHRIGLSCEKFTSLFMPSDVKGSGTTCKIVSIPKVGAKGLASSTIVFDEEGSVQWLVNSELLTAVRTAAGSALTAKLLAQKESENLTVFGSGIQAEYHIRLISQACPNIKRVTLINRTRSRAEELINKLKADLTHLEFAILPSASEEDPKSTELISEAVKNSQIICTCTPSLSPILLGNWISPQTHICSVGSYTPQMHEFDNDLIQRSKLILVDSIDSANIEAGELISAKESGLEVNMLELGKLIDIESNSVNLGELISNNDKAKDLTLFKSVGIPSQDVTITLAIVQLAKRLKLGTEVEF